MKPVTESQTQRAVLDYLAAKRIWHVRQNSGAIRDATGRPVRFGRPGMADVLVLWKSRFADPTFNWHDEIIPLWLEIKSPAGKQSPAQKAFQAEVEAEGHAYFVIKSIDQLIEFFEAAREI